MGVVRFWSRVEVKFWPRSRVKAENWGSKFLTPVAIQSMQPTSLVLTTYAGTVSSDKSRGKTVQQLGDDPPCGTPVECYAQAIEALKEAEQKIEGLNNAILTLNKTLEQVVANQSRVNEQL